MERTEEELKKIAFVVSNFEDAVSEYSFVSDRGSLGEIEDAREDVIAARNELFEVIGGCESLMEDFEPEWPEDIYVEGAWLDAQKYREEFQKKYEKWADEHQAQLLELIIDHERFIGWLVQATDPGETPEGLNRLAIRSDDSNNDPIDLEDECCVNRYGWYFTPQEPDFTPQSIDDWNYVS